DPRAPPDLRRPGGLGAPVQRHRLDRSPPGYLARGGGSLMAWWRAVAGELSALGTLAALIPLGLLVRDGLDPTAPHPTPAVSVHGVAGTRPTSLFVRTSTGGRAPRTFAGSPSPPRIDYQRLVPRLARRIEKVCRDTGAPRVDVVGHSLGGLVARHLVEFGDG